MEPFFKPREANKSVMLTSEELNQMKLGGIPVIEFSKSPKPSGRKQNPVKRTNSLS